MSSTCRRRSPARWWRASPRRSTLAEIARSRRDTTNLHARQLAWRAAGLYLDAYNGGNAALMQQAIAACEEAIAADAASLAAHFTLVGAHWICHLYRWGDRPDGALDRAWAVVERMTAINSQDERTLTVRGWTRVNRGEYDGGLADLRRATRSIRTTLLPSSRWLLPRRPRAWPRRRKRTPSSRCD